MYKTSVLPALCVAALLGSSALLHPAWAQPSVSQGASQEAPPRINDGVLTLSEAIQKALGASPRLKSARDGLDAAKGAQMQASTIPNPQFEVVAENIAGSGRFGGFDSAETTLGISQEIEVGGKRDYRVQAAAQGAVYGQYALTIERLNLIRDVQVAYHNAVAAQEALALAKERKALAKEMRQSVNKRVQSAAEPEVQLRKAEIGLSTATVIEGRARREFTHTKHVLASLWAGHEGQFMLEDASFFALSAPPSEDEVEAKLAKSADLIRRDAQTSQMQALYELERAQAMPNPKFMLGLRDLRASDNQALIAGVAVPIPVFNSNRGNIASAKSKVSQAKNDKLSAHLVLRNAVFESLEEMINAYSHAQTLKKDIIPSAQQAFKLARNGYQAGRFPYLEVLDSQRTLFEVKEQYIAALKAYHVSRANVQRMTTEIGEQK